MMALADVLTRLVVVYLRGHRLTVKAVPVIAPSGRGPRLVRAWFPSSAR